MPRNITRSNPMTVQQWSAMLFLQMCEKSYFEKRFTSKNGDTPIQRLDDLEKGQGDTISYDLNVNLRQQPTFGDARLEGREEDLSFYTDVVSIDQMRAATTQGGTMSRKRTKHDMKKLSRDQLSTWFARVTDEMQFIYLSGDRGDNHDFILNKDFIGMAMNPILEPDDNHIMFGGKGIVVADEMTETDYMTKDVIENAVLRAKTLTQYNPDANNLQPVVIDGKEHYVLVMSSQQAHDMRVYDKEGWLEMQKFAITSSGKKNPIFEGGLGMIANVVLHEHSRVIRFDEYGVNKIKASRALFMGAQAGVIAYGSPADSKGSTTKSGARFSWAEDSRDYDNENTNAIAAISGVKKTRFNDMDYGVIAIDTAHSNSVK